MIQVIHNYAGNYFLLELIHLPQFSPVLMPNAPVE